MKINILRGFLIALLILQMWIIFGFSGQDGETSGTISRRITETITKNIKSIQDLEEVEKEKVLKKIEHFIRKLAHFSLYTMVGFLLMSLVSTYKLKLKNKICISLGIGFMYAISDEIHQSFIPERTPMISDVCIDTCGVITGIAALIVIQFIWNSIFSKN